MKDWIMELCPEIAECQAELIAEQAQKDTAAAVDAERVVIMDSLQKQADLATDALDRRWALEMKAAVAARRIGVKA